MPYSTIVLTAGISALAPRNIIGQALRKDGSPLYFPAGQQNPVPTDPDVPDEDVAKGCVAFLEKTQANSLADPSAVSAEYSMLHQLKEMGKLSPGTVAHLIHTPTLGGRLAVALQQSFLEQLGVQPHAEELSVPFDPSQPGGLALASGAFIGRVSSLLKLHDPRQAAFAPIGGYKVMVALGHTAASFHRFPSLYLHEDSQVLQEIAPAPVSVPSSPELVSLARKIGNGLETTSLTEAETLLLQNNPAWFTRVDDLVELNELGQFLRLNEIPILLSPDAQTELEKESNLLTSQLLQIRDLASQNPEHPGINHDLVGIKGRVHSWRLARMGNGIRIAWQILGEDLVIRQIWRDHDGYEREAPKTIMEEIPERFPQNCRRLG